MGSHPEESPLDVSGVAPQEDVDTADVPEDREQEPDEKPNYTERRPEHFRNSPGHVREVREEPRRSNGQNRAVER